MNLFINIILLSRRSPRSLGDIRYESVLTLTLRIYRYLLSIDQNVSNEYTLLDLVGTAVQYGTYRTV